MKKISDSVFEVRVPYSSGFEWWVLLTADHHWDNPKCKRTLLKSHLEEAKAKNAPTFVFGDLFCAMQGRYDKRSSKSDIRPEHQEGNYLDRLVDTAVDWYGKYDIPLITPGNHETSILKRHETDLTQRLAQGISDSFDKDCFAGTYSGWVIFKFHEKNARVHTIRLSYHHGYGGGGPVTKGVIQTNRKGVYLPDAHIVVQGHIHESWKLDVVRERLNAKGKRFLDKQVHICLPTYKEEYLQKKGWHTETGKPPKPLGGYWIRFYYKKNRIKLQVIEAD